MSSHGNTCATQYNLFLVDRVSHKAGMQKVTSSIPRLLAGKILLVGPRASKLAYIIILLHATINFPAEQFMITACVTLHY